MEDRYLVRAKALKREEWIMGDLVRYGCVGQEKHYIVPCFASDLYDCAIREDTIVERM